MSASLRSISEKEFCDRLREWQEQEQLVSLHFSSGAGNISSLTCSGKISFIGLTKLSLSWKNNGYAEINYNNAKLNISEDGFTLSVSHINSTDGFQITTTLNETF